MPLSVAILVGMAACKQSRVIAECTELIPENPGDPVSYAQFAGIHLGHFYAVLPSDSALSDPDGCGTYEANDLHLETLIDMLPSDGVPAGGTNYAATYELAYEITVDAEYAACATAAALGLEASGEVAMQGYRVAETQRAVSTVINLAAEHPDYQDFLDLIGAYQQQLQHPWDKLDRLVLITQVQTAEEATVSASSQYHIDQSVKCPGGRVHFTGEASCNLAKGLENPAGSVVGYDYLEYDFRWPGLSGEGEGGSAGNGTLALDQSLSQECRVLEF